MKRCGTVIGRGSTLVLGIVVATTALVSNARAGCGSFDPHQSNAFGSGAAETQQDDQQGDRPYEGGNTIVGMWKVSFVATDGSGYMDFGYSQWHSDGTEFLNSGSRAPSTQNYCLGVWKKTGEASYRLNHFALSYDGTTGMLNGKVNIKENVAVEPNGNKYAGTFTILIYDPTGAMVVARVEGKITGTRVTVDTTTP